MQSRVEILKSTCTGSVRVDSTGISSLPYGVEDYKPIVEMLMERLIPLSQMESIVGFKKSKIYALIDEGNFPKPIKVGRNSRWRSSEIEAWIESVASRTVV